MILTWILLKSAATIFENYPSVYSVMALPLKTTWSKCFRSNGRNGLYAGSQRQHPFYTSKRILKIPVWDLPCIRQTSVYKGYKQDKIEMRGNRAEMSDFPLYLNTVAGGLDRRDQTIGGFSFVVKIYAVPVVEIIG